MEIEKWLLFNRINIEGTGQAVAERDQSAGVIPPCPAKTAGTLRDIAAARAEGTSDSSFPVSYLLIPERLLAAGGKLLCTGFQSKS